MSIVFSVVLIIGVLIGLYFLIKLYKDKVNETENAVMRGVKKVYKPLLGISLKLPWLMVGIATALVLVATTGKIAETYNIGGHNEKQNIEVVHIICDLLEELAPQKPKGVKCYKDLITLVADRAGHDVRYAIDASKIAKELDWIPLETFNSGIRKTVKWYLDNLLFFQRQGTDSY